MTGPNLAKLHADAIALKATYGHLLAGVPRMPDPERDAAFDRIGRLEPAQTALDLYPPTKGTQ